MSDLRDSVPSFPADFFRKLGKPFSSFLARLKEGRNYSPFHRRI